MDSGEYEEAITAFEALDGYKDSEAKIAACIAACEIELLKIAEVGDSVYYGTYEQDYDATDAEAIEWLVLDKKDDKLLVISKYALDCQPYNSEDVEVTWEDCTLRTWLNDDFMNEAFSAAEQSYIVQTTVTADKNPEHDIDPGNDTEDKIFLLSIDEAEKYTDRDLLSACEATVFAVANGAEDPSWLDGNTWWWLRTLGEYDSKYQYHKAAGFDWYGEISRDGSVVDHGKAVRPALWINLDA